MRVGIFTDAHSNFEALKAVSQQLQSEYFDRLIFLGDAIGYGADPNDCCRIIREQSDIALLGNHDAVLVEKLDMSWFVDYAREAVDWTSKVIDTDHRDWLATLPYVHREKDVVFSHGSPLDPENFHYVMDYQEALRILRWMGYEGVGVTFVGHAHIGLAFRLIGSSGDPGKIEESVKVHNFNGINSAKVELKPEDRWVINVGAVGQPRDGDTRAVYAVFDTESRIYEVHRVEYDIDSASSRIEAAGLPQILADRLFIGK